MQEEGAKLSGSEDRLSGRIKLQSPERRAMRDKASFGERDQDFVVIHIMSERARSHANGDI